MPNNVFLYDFHLDFRCVMLVQYIYSVPRVCDHIRQVTLHVHIMTSSTNSSFKNRGISNRLKINTKIHSKQDNSISQILLKKYKIGLVFSSFHNFDF